MFTFYLHAFIQLDKIFFFHPRRVHSNFTAFYTTFKRYIHDEKSKDERVPL